MQIIQLTKLNEDESTIPEAVSTPPLQSWPINKQFNLYDQKVDAVSKEGNLFIPSSFINDGTQWDIWYPKLLEWIESGRMMSKQDQWIVGSAKLDLLLKERTAQSHASGHAVDISPIWDDENLLDPDGASPALAWNLASLAALSHYHSNQLSWVVEGDHIHLTDNGLPELKEQGVVAVFTSLSTAYPLFALTAETDALKPLINKIYGFRVDQDSVTFSRLTSDADLFKYIGE